MPTATIFPARGCDHAAVDHPVLGDNVAEEHRVDRFVRCGQASVWK
jgi:hypothetical protein